MRWLHRLEIKAKTRRARPHCANESTAAIGIFMKAAKVRPSRKRELELKTVRVYLEGRRTVRRAFLKHPHPLRGRTLPGSEEAAECEGGSSLSETIPALWNFQRL